jgi:putative ABC transport system permease protein
MRDLKFAFRQLLKSPAFTVIAVLTLALGIGANTAIFSIVNGVLLKPLEYPESDRLIWLAERGSGWTGGAIAYPNFADWKAQQSVFENFGVFNWNNFTLTGKGEPIQLSGARMSADVFPALRARPALGRFFSDDEDKPGAPNVVVLSYSIWQSRFGADSGIINKTISLDGEPYTVVGVAPADFSFPTLDLALWVPVGPLSAKPDWQNRGNHPGLQGLARLKPGITLEKARAELDAIATRLEEKYPETNKTRRVQIDLFLDNMVGNVRRALWTLLGAVGLVLLIACANVANLFLARAASRQQEMVVRAALGASRWQILRQLLTESVLLAALGGLSGLLVARGALHLILTLARETLPRTDGITLDGTVLGFSALIAMLTGILFGLAPGWQASRPDLQQTLKASGRGATTGPARLRHGLVVAEVALTMLLLAGAGLLLRSFYQLQRMNPGFNHERVLTFRLSLPEKKYSSMTPVIGFYQRLLEKLRAVPGVLAASVASRIPLEDGAWDTTFLIEGQPEPPPHLRPSMDVQVAGPDYFRAMGIPILRGRPFSERDNREHLRGTPLEQQWAAGLTVMIISEDFAHRFWPGQDPIGKRVRMGWGGDAPSMTVIGVVPTLKWRRLAENAGNVQGFLPFLQLPLNSMSIVIKTSLEPAALVTAARQQVLSLDPDQPIFGIETLSEKRDRSLAPHRMQLWLLGIFAGLALLLAIIGLYGVLSYAVTQRRREIGIRMALGARSTDVLRLVVGHGMRLALFGIGLGLVASLCLTRLMKSLVFGVSTIDPLTFSANTLVLVAVALFACWLPARRATKIEPMQALRYE